ncbi:unnamed protein product [Paramecium pentaurelia]|uniref:Uncharacterized protein n=1 Tax=Paramecium pentaurelia TaxID=43138 RepID=A0A8S1SR05_9CILI|nr:unnamed protein product [Paramecium pentaurelia]
MPSQAKKRLSKESLKKLKLLQKSISKNRVQEINQNLILDMDDLINFFKQNKALKLYKGTLSYFKINPLNNMLYLLSSIQINQQQYKYNQDQLQKKVIYGLLQLFEEKRVIPKILGCIKLENGNFKLNNNLLHLSELITLAFLNDDYKFKNQEKIEIDESQPINDQYLLLLSLQLLQPHADQFLNPKHLNHQDFNQIYETYKLISTASEKDQINKQIKQIYTNIAEKINSLGCYHLSNEILNKSNNIELLRSYIIKKLVIISITQINEQKIGLPEIVRKITLSNPDLTNFVGQKGGVELRYPLFFIKQLSKQDEIKDQKLQYCIRQLDENLNWLELKSLYYNTILPNYQNYELLSEEDIIIAQLEILDQNFNKYERQIRKHIKKPSAKSQIIQIENILKEESNNSQIPNQLLKKLTQIGQKLIQFRDICNSESHQKPKVPKYARKILEAPNKVAQPAESYNCLSDLLKYERLKFSHFIRFFGEYLINKNVPYPYFFEILKCGQSCVRVDVRITTIEQFVQDAHFINFIFEEYQIDISGLSLRERANKLGNVPYDVLIKNHIFKECWGDILIKQAQLIYENRKTLQWELVKRLKNEKVLEVFTQIEEQGRNISWKRLELQREIIKLKNYLQKQQ